MAVPSPQSAFVLTGALIYFAQRRRRHTYEAEFTTVVAGDGGNRDPCMADIRVTVRGFDGVERNVGSLHTSGAAITITTQELAEAARTVQNPWYNYEFVRIYDTNALNGGTTIDTVGPVTIVDNTTTDPPQIRVLVAPPPDQLRNREQ
jgi:hypothetical protein